MWQLDCDYRKLFSFVKNQICVLGFVHHESALRAKYGQCRVIRISSVSIAPHPTFQTNIVCSHSCSTQFDTMFRVLISALLVCVAAAQPVRVSVKGSHHLFATNAEINRIVDRAEQFLAENMRTAVGHSSFLRHENRSRDIKEALFLTQPMRSPSPFKLSVNERENAVFEATKSHSLAAAAEAVADRMAFEHGVAQLR